MSTPSQKDIALISRYRKRGAPREITMTLQEGALMEEFRARMPDGWVMSAEHAPVFYQDGRAEPPPPYIRVVMWEKRDMPFANGGVSLRRRIAVVRADREAMEQNFREFLLEFGLKERAVA